MVPLLFSEMGLKVVLSRVLSILVSWSDTFVGTTEDIPTITEGSAVTLVKLFTGYRETRRKGQNQIVLEPPDITEVRVLTSGRIHLEHPLLPLARQQQQKHPPGQATEFPPLVFSLRK